MVWQPMIKMTCIAPNCVMPIERRRWIAYANLAQKILADTPIPTTKRISVADASLLIRLNCQSVSCWNPKIFQWMSRTASPRRPPDTSSATKTFKILTRWRQHGSSVQQTMRT